MAIIVHLSYPLIVNGLEPLPPDRFEATLLLGNADHPAGVRASLSCVDSYSRNDRSSVPPMPPYPPICDHLLISCIRQMRFPSLRWQAANIRHHAPGMPGKIRFDTRMPNG